MSEHGKRVHLRTYKATSIWEGRTMKVEKLSHLWIATHLPLSSWQACLTIRRDFLWEVCVFIYSTEYHQSIKSIMFVSSSEIPKHSVFSRTDRNLVSGPAPPVSKRRAELNANCQRPVQANEKVELLSGKTYLATFQLSLL